MEKWIPIKFDPDVERVYAKHLLARFIPLGRLAFVIGIIAFIVYGFWDLMLDPNAMESTGPIRLVAILHFMACIGITYLPSVRRNLGYWPLLVVYCYCGYAILFVMILSQLPGGFVAGVGGLTLGAIFIPAITSGERQAAYVLAPFLLVFLITMALLGATNFELINALAWTGGAVGFAISFAYLLNVINRKAFQLERQLESEKQRSEALLLNILPAEIATRLKEQEEPLADTHESVSVNAGAKMHHLAGVKIHHFARLQVCPQTRLAQCLPQQRSYAGLWSSRIVWEWSGVQGLIALLQPITVTVHFQDMNMMRQPI